MSFIFEEGRYYHAMWYLDLPPVPGATGGCTHGGNVVILLWHFDHEPDDWHLQYRFRYYRDKDLTDQSKDEMVWYEAIVKCGSMEHVLKGPQVIMAGLAAQCRKLGLDAKPQELLIEGDDHKFWDAVEKQKPHWLALSRAEHWHGE